MDVGGVEKEILRGKLFLLPIPMPFQYSDYPHHFTITLTHTSHTSHTHHTHHTSHTHTHTHTASLKSAAAVITLASMSFSSPHTLSQSMRRSHGVTRGQVDSTPRLVNKLDIGASVIVNGGVDSTPSTVPGSPKSVSEVIMNTGAIDSLVPGDAGHAHQDPTPKPTADQWGAEQLTGDDKSAGLFRAIFDFEASSDQELTLRSGDLVTVLDKSDSGWWKGECEGGSGWFPETYVQPVASSTQEAVPGGVVSSPSMWEQEVAGEREGGEGGREEREGGRRGREGGEGGREEREGGRRGREEGWGRRGREEREGGEGGRRGREEGWGRRGMEGGEGGRRGRDEGWGGEAERERVPSGKGGA